MNLDEFEAQYRNTIDQAFNQLQAAVLLLAQVQAQIETVASEVRLLSETVEEFILQQRAE